MVNTSDILPNTPRYLKVPLIFFNAVLWILGLILIIIGSWALKQLKNVSGLSINVTLPAGLIVLGVFIIILTVLGCVVAYKEQLVGLIAYTVVILILLICLIGVGGAAFSYRGNTPSLLTKAWAKANVGVQAPIERYFDCCGWGGQLNLTANATLHSGALCILTTNTTLYNYTENSNNTGTLPPVPYIVTTYSLNPNTTDCQPTLTNYVQDRLYVAGVAGVVIGVIELVCMLFSLFLIIRLCRNPRSRSYD